MKVVLTGGGTGGHIYPALAIAEGLQKKYPGVELLYIGDSTGMEVDIVGKTKIPLQTIPLSGMERKISLENVKAVFQSCKGIFSARRMMKKFKPDLVVGTGGYVCGPIVLAAALSGIPTVIHEQNAYPGVTNKLLARFVDLILVTFAESAERFPTPAKVKVTGLPVRPEILQLAAEKARTDNAGQSGPRITFADREKPLVLCFGGSLGAESLNQAMTEVIARELQSETMRILLATGREAYAAYQRQFADRRTPEGTYGSSGSIRIEPYIYDMAGAFREADLIICRAGAATLAEITALGIPAVLVPFPYASENHQEYNALALVNQGAAIMIKDSELSGQRLYASIQELIHDSKALETMQENSLQLGKIYALDNIINLIAELLTRKHN